MKTPLPRGAITVERIVRIPLPGRKLPTRANVQGTWDQFLAGPENPLVSLAVEAVLAESHPEYNPVVFYGTPRNGQDAPGFGAGGGVEGKICPASGSLQGIAGFRPRLDRSVRDGRTG